ncbi:hypothetical protein Dsin_019360 [Dipteronia sinensis]|uniref:DDE Tnp4 domain-containing protein n=1 Tax=Dipteronia sinensis TaxID=43782 RepID=A0AAE0A7T0_9ROSI|nr:hypothetical protein Dsin_019360 [Dipteronia sinensis]
MNDDEMSEEEDIEIDEDFYEAIKILVMAVQSVIQVVNELRVIEFATNENVHKMLKALNTLSTDMMAKLRPVVLAKIREYLKKFPYFKDCIEAIDGTHILTTVTGHDNNSFCDPHRNISQNVLTICNFDLKFIYGFVGWEGSAHDSKLLNDVLSRMNRLKATHALPFPFKTQVEIVLAYVALHNFLRKECRSDILLKKNLHRHHHQLFKRNFEELVSQTQKQQREKANAWRLSIADHMWRERY